MHFQGQSGIEAREGEHSSQTAICLTARVRQSDFGRYSRLVSALWLSRSLNAQIENALNDNLHANAGHKMAIHSKSKACRNRNIWRIALQH
jgi:hypothetical protein